MRTTKALAKQAAWLWLPLFLGVCVVLGAYNSYLAPESSGSQVTLCPDSSHLNRFLGCP